MTTPFSLPADARARAKMLAESLARSEEEQVAENEAAEQDLGQEMQDVNEERHTRVRTDGVARVFARWQDAREARSTAD